MQICWPVALLSCNNWAFTLLIVRAYFMSYCKKQANIFFTWYRCIAREQTIATIHMSYREDTNTNHAICKLSIARSNNNNEHVFHIVS
jgi:hypothetical protein